MLHTLALHLMRGITQAQTLEILRHNIHLPLLFSRPQEALSEVNPAMRRRLSEAIAEHQLEAMERAKRELEFCEKHNIQLLSIHDSRYPKRLAECPDAPALLFYLGEGKLNVRHTISVVGTRRITPYGKDICRLLCADLARLLPDTLVVSGLAYGVDVHVHRGCLENGLSTVGVLAHGLDQIYPTAHNETAKQMLQQGGLLTEYISQTRAVAGNFVRRNRIVAGMTDATIVVESAHKGGALITARLAADYDRLVCAYPGRTTDACSEGCNHLIRDRRAELVTSANDILDLLGWGAHPTASPAVQLDLFEGLSPEQQLLVDALRGTDGQTAAQLSIKTNLDLSTINTLLFELEMTGVLKLLPGGCYRLLPRK